MKTMKNPSDFKTNTNRDDKRAKIHKSEPKKAQRRAAEREENMSSSDAELGEWKLESDEFVVLLEKLINESKHLQNAPTIGLIPEEERAAKHVLDVLLPFAVVRPDPAPLSAEKPLRI